MGMHIVDWLIKNVKGVTSIEAAIQVWMTGGLGMLLLYLTLTLVDGRRPLEQRDHHSP